MRKSVVCLNRLELLKDKFLSIKNRAQRAQEENRAQVSPTGTTCLIGKAGHLEHVLKPISARSCSPWGAKTSQMGV
jgi:hypothetical protein